MHLQDFKIRVPFEREGSPGAPLIAWAGAIRSHAAVVVFDKNPASSDDMDLVGAGLNTFSARLTRIGAVQPVFSDGISEP